MSATDATGLAKALTRLGDVCPHVRQAGEADEVGGVRGRVVARPESTAQTADVLRVAGACGLAVVVRGRGTKLSWGNPPERLDVVLDTSAMSAVVDHAAGDLVVEVDAGARLADVNAVICAQGQRLALDETTPGGSIGGTVATGASGPLRLFAGTARDTMIGATFVRADGVVGHTGGRVVKNVAGYDLGKLLVGSFGTLAVLTRAVFRLHPIPPARAVVTTTVSGPDAAATAAALVRLVMHSQVVPSALELDAPRAGQVSVSVLLEGTQAGVAARARDLCAVLGSQALVEDGQPSGWGAYPWRAGGTGLKATFAASGLADVLAACWAGHWGDGAGEPAGPPVVRGSAGAGVLYVGLGVSTSHASLADLLRRMRRACTAHGGAVTVVDAPAQIKAAVDLWGPVAGVQLMRAVKEQFDPGRVLAPARFVGGI